MSSSQFLTIEALENASQGYLLTMALAHLWHSEKEPHSGIRLHSKSTHAVGRKRFVVDRP